MRHNAIIVTGTNYEDEMDKAHAKAIVLFPESVSEAIPSIVNGYTSFFIAPDGSKEIRSVSEYYDTQRKMFSDFVDSLAYEDGSNAVWFVDVGFNEHNETAIDRTNKPIVEEED